MTRLQFESLTITSMPTGQVSQYLLTLLTFSATMLANLIQDGMGDFWGPSDDRLPS